MCGIAGWLPGRLGSSQPEDRLRAVADTLAHRGPDDRGTFRDEESRLVLLHNRLSIIDLTAAGHQPMTSEDGAVTVTFNGEIYNFQTLRAELVARGHRFRSRTDSEVLLEGYRAWGAGVLPRLKGMFAFAIWDRGDRTLLLARDPMGIKPLYFWWSDQGDLAFASEVKAFLELEGFSPRPNIPMLRQYLEFNFIPDPSETSLQGVHKLPAGHALRVRADGRDFRPLPERYYSPPRVEPWDGAVESLDTRADRLFETLSEVMDEHLVADVPLALLLSGGIDSSIIAALARKRQPVRTLTMAFAESGLDEREPARRVATFLGTQHTELVIQPHEVAGDLGRAVWYVDDLFGDWGVISTMLLYRKCREAGAKVVLVGEGSDELFGGYPDFVRAGGEETDALSRFRRGLRLYRCFSGQRWGGELVPFLRLFRDLDDESGGDAFSAVRLFETRHQLPHQYNMKVDKASMSASVEARVPFLDVRVANEGFRTPRSLLLRNGTNKFLLRHMAERHGLLPKDTVWRKKFGGSIAAGWMEGSPGFRRFAQEVILDPAGWTKSLGLLRPMEDYFVRGRAGYPFPARYSILRILAWRLLLLELWARLYLKAPLRKAA